MAASVIGSYWNTTKAILLKQLLLICCKTYASKTYRTRKIPPCSIPPNLTLTQTLTMTQVGIHRGGIDQGEIFRTPIDTFQKTYKLNWQTVLLNC